MAGYGGVPRRETRSYSVPHSVQCRLGQSTGDQSPKKRRRAEVTGRRLQTGRRRPKLLQAAVDSCAACLLDALTSGGVGGVDLRDEDGYTALMLAVEVGSLEIAELLIGQGADVRVRNNWGETALYLAVNRSGTNARAIIERLIVRDRTTVDLRPHSGFTPLFRAAGNYHVDTPAIVRDLVEASADLEVRGADPDVLNGRVMGPFELAATVGNFQVCQLLYLAGCRVGVVHEWMREDSFPRILRRNRQWMVTLVGWATQPRMLQELCRIVIRRAIIGAGRVDVRQCRERELPLPISLAKFVLCGDL